MTRKKQCSCGAWFAPYPRAWKTQKTCSKACRARRVKELCCRWRASNSGYFKGRYPDTKRWLAKHPNYLRRYRAKYPGYVEADNKHRRERRLRRSHLRADIQNGLLRREIAAIRTFQGADIQNRMAPSTTGVLA